MKRNIGTAKSLLIVVEDNPNHQELILEALGSSDVEMNIHCFDDGSKALDFIYGLFTHDDGLEDAFLIILVDLNLPGVDGKEILRVMKGDKRTSSIPIVVFTSSDRTEDIVECYSLGANSYIVKPVSLHELIEKVRTIPDYWFRKNKIVGV